MTQSERSLLARARIVGTGDGVAHGDTRRPIQFHEVTPLETFGADLASVRRAAGITVEQLATRAGYSVPYVWRLEHGQRRPRLSTLDRLAAALGARTGTDTHDRLVAHWCSRLGDVLAPPSEYSDLVDARRAERDRQRIHDAERELEALVELLPSLKQAAQMSRSVKMAGQVSKIEARIAELRVVLKVAGQDHGPTPAPKSTPEGNRSRSREARLARLEAVEAKMARHSKGLNR